ncbi:MAG: glycosyltransferase family 2 protein [Terriglobales bacterium]
MRYPMCASVNTTILESVPLSPKLSQELPEKGNTCAIVVTYEPDDGIASRIGLIKGQVARVIVVDNGSERVEVLKSIATDGITFIRNTQNQGIAKALNQGMLRAMEEGFTWVLLLDQDTIPSAEMVQKIGDVYSQHPSKEKLAMIGCNPFPENTDVSGLSWKSVKMVITSGTLLALRAARVIGPFRDELFIDCVDFEYCIRARLVGFEIVELLSPVMKHFIGVAKEVPFRWSKAKSSNHRPWRWYYVVRNMVFLTVEYGVKDWDFVLPTLYARVKALLLTLLLDDSRLLRTKFIVLGLLDGLSGRFDRQIAPGQANAVTVRAS